MNRDFSQTLKVLGTDTPLKDGKDEDFTLAKCAIEALMAVFPDERELSGDDKVKRYKLASLIHKGGLVEITAEELSLLKRLIGKFYSPLIVGQAYAMLEADPA